MNHHHQDTKRAQDKQLHKRIIHIGADFPTCMTCLLVQSHTLANNKIKTNDMSPT